MNILITGANRGLGLELVHEALERGHSVIAGIRSIEPGGKLSSLKLELSEPERLTIVKLDVAEESSVAEAASKLANSHTGVDAIVNNAAILTGRDKPIEELDMEQLSLSFEINVYGPIRVVKHLLPLMNNGGGAIINVSSEAGSITNAYGGDYPYGISKTALNMFSHQLKHAVKERDIVVYAVHPGWMQTDMGGDSAPTHPRQSAAGIIDLIERKTIADGFFIDYKGEAMPI